jgi:elongator complex protein 3
VESYVSCGGLEHFISFEDVNQDILIGFLRLRYPHNPHRQELRHSALVRDLHVYGSLVPPGKEAKAGEWQHRGYGAELLKTAEEMAKAAGYRELSIVSGIGVREYYRKFGYHLNGVYMSRLL